MLAGRIVTHEVETYDHPSPQPSRLETGNKKLETPSPWPSPAGRGGGFLGAWEPSTESAGLSSRVPTGTKRHPRVAALHDPSLALRALIDPALALGVRFVTHEG